MAEICSPRIGRPPIDPEAAVRLMLAGVLLGIVHDRRLMREAQVTLAIRRFAGFGLHVRLPDHPSSTRIRRRRGAERFRSVFERMVQACVAAGIARGEIVHIDASVVRADVARESLAVRHVGAVQEANGDDAPDTQHDTVPRHSRKTGTFKKVCLTGPDASMATSGMATSGRNRKREPSHKQHSGVDDQLGVVPEVGITTGEVNEGEQMLARLGAAARATGAPIATVTADAGYACGEIFGGLEARGIAAIIPTKAAPIRSPVPLRRFRHEARNDIVRCPRGKILRPGKPVKHGRFFHSRSRDCSRCDLEAPRISRGRMTRSVVIGEHHPAHPAHPARDVGGNDGAPRTTVRTSVADGGRKGIMARPRPGTASHALSDAARRTCASWPSSPQQQ